MTQFEHQRHKPPSELDRQRELVVACPAFRSNVNFSRIVRAAACSGIRRLVSSGTGKVDPTIARDGADAVEISVHRTLLPILKKFRDQGMELVGLEQTTDSQSLYEFDFKRKTVLVLGHERHGITEDVLSVLDRVVEIPVFGMPYSYNVATAAAMTMYEYCRQFPRG